ncbi:MAG: amidohydrolase family protein, partial [Candidatus Odinarchaeia archaeon]
VKMATIGGAKVLFWDKEIGSLEIGKKADVLVVDCSAPHSVPLYNEYSHLTYALKSSDVEYLMVDGKLIVEKRKITTINVEEILEKVKKWKADRINQ